MREKESPIVVATRWGTAGLILLNPVLTACSKNTKTPQETLTQITEPTPEPTLTPSPSKTSTKTSTATVTTTPSEIPSPTLDTETINRRLIEQSLEGEVIVLEDITVDNVIIFDIQAKELIGAWFKIEDRRIIIENFDCEFKSLREQGKLGDMKEPQSSLPIRIWDMSNVTFDRITVIKNDELPDNTAFLTSESYVLGDDEMECVEEPVFQPTEQLIRAAWGQVAEFISELIENEE